MSIRRNLEAAAKKQQEHADVLTDAVKWIEALEWFVGVLSRGETKMPGMGGMSVYKAAKLLELADERVDILINGRSMRRDMGAEL